MTLFLGLSGSYGVILGDNMDFYTQKAHFKAAMDHELTFFMKYATYIYLMLILIINGPIGIFSRAFECKIFPFL